MSDPVITDTEALARKLHEWYLEAIKLIDKKNYNQKAVKSYDELNEQQRYIDVWIASQIRNQIKKEIMEFFNYVK